MAIAIAVLSNDGGKDKALIIAASRKDAQEVAGIAKRLTGSKYMGIDNPQAALALSDAWGEVEETAEQYKGVTA